MTPWHHIAQEFATRRYVLIRQLIPRRDCEKLFRHVLHEVDWMRADNQVPGSPAAYADPEMEQLLQHLLPAVQKMTGLKLYPTYSYLRVYRRGAVLRRHTDRPACEVSLTLNLGQRSRASWPLWIENALGKFPLAMKPGDATLYRGMECPHWREEFKGQLAAQVFLHYVEKRGPHAEWKFDKRKPGARSRPEP
jgi:hypothetical protein